VKKNPEKPAWIDASALLPEKASLVFTNRHGGVSKPPYDSLNLGFRGGDDPSDVAENRSIVASRLGIEPERFIYLEQVHSTSVRRATSVDGARALDPGDAFAETDGSYSFEPLTVLAVLTADCLPVALAHRDGLFVALLHAGWKGTIGNIVSSALSAIRREVSFDPQEIVAVMGPGIGPCCYQVDEGRAFSFVEEYGDDAGVVRWGARPSIDLFAANRINLIREGLREENIKTAGFCTCCNPDCFSFRREGRTGRQAALLYLERE
jgi:hypothetical protein